MQKDSPSAQEGPKPRRKIYATVPVWIDEDLDRLTYLQKRSGYRATKARTISKALALFLKGDSEWAKAVREFKSAVEGTGA